jgi:protein gp37
MKETQLRVRAYSCGDTHPCTRHRCFNNCLLWLLPHCVFVNRYYEVYENNICLDFYNTIERLIEQFAKFLFVMINNPLPNCCQFLEHQTLERLKYFGTLFDNQRVEKRIEKWNERNVPVSKILINCLIIQQQHFNISERPATTLVYFSRLSHRTQQGDRIYQP